MAIRVDIDEEDLNRFLKETCKRSRQDIAVLASACATVLGGGLSALFVAWRTAGSLSGPISSPSLVTLAGAVICASGFAFLAFAIFRGRRRNAGAARRETAKAGLTTGRFEFHFSDKALIVKGAQATRKFAWPGLDRIAETKTNIVFWRRGEPVAFIPHSSIADSGFYEKLARLYGPAVSNKLAGGSGGGANPHKITFECTEGDFAEYQRHYNASRDGRLASLRRLFHWPLWPAMLFTAALAVTAFSVYGFIMQGGLTLGALSAAAGVSSVFLFLLSDKNFQDRALKLKKRSVWPFASSELFSVTLFRDGFCVSRGDSDEIYPWSAIEQFMVCPLTSYLVLTPQLIVPAPKRAFVDKVHFRAFANYARAHIEAAKKQSTEQSEARLARQLSPGVSVKKTPKSLPAPKAASGKAPQKKLPGKPAPIALPAAKPKPSAAPVKSNQSAVAAVRAAAKARASTAA